jgi:hypothetical protein
VTIKRDGRKKVGILEKRWERDTGKYFSKFELRRLEEQNSKRSSAQTLETRVGKLRNATCKVQEKQHFAYLKIEEEDTSFSAREDFMKLVYNFEKVKAAPRPF